MYLCKIILTMTWSWSKCCISVVILFYHFSSALRDTGVGYVDMGEHLGHSSRAKVLKSDGASLYLTRSVSCSGFKSNIIHFLLVLFWAGQCPYIDISHLPFILFVHLFPVEKGGGQVLWCGLANFWTGFWRRKVTIGRWPFWALVQCHL